RRLRRRARCAGLRARHRQVSGRQDRRQHHPRRRAPLMKLSADLDGVRPTLIRRVVDAAPPGAINLGLGQPVIDVDPRISEAAAAAVHGPAPYSANTGLPALRKAIAERYDDHDPETILVTAGAEQALFLALAGLLDPDDEILLPDPGFPAYAL